jgi:hypothetical protein
MSKIGNGSLLFKIERTRQFVEVDSADAKFNETFSDCMDKKGKIIKGGRVLDPDLYNVPDMEADILKSMETWNETENVKRNSRFADKTIYENFDDENEDDENVDSNEKKNDESDNDKID